MEEIRAFVGHSFTAADKDVVREFLEYFQTLTNGYPFTWDHAEQAEPETLAKKVLAKIRDKNVFIGICTRKERAIEPGSLWLISWLKKAAGNEADFEWKTSDWIIQ